MKVVYTDDALRDLDEILTFIAATYPTAFAPFEKRLHTAIARIGAWPAALRRPASSATLALAQRPALN